MVEELNSEDIKVYLCVIIKMENPYLVDFMEHYKSIGIDKVIVYDNNDVDGERPEDVIQSYISDGFVIINNYRGMKSPQMTAYNDCYKRFGEDCDWICFFDCDEYLCLKQHKNIKDFLSDSRFNGFNSISVNWMLYGDNGLIWYEDKPLEERFTNPLPFDKKINYSFPENNHIKSILRCGNHQAKFGNPHFASGGIVACDCGGKRCSNGPFVPYSFDVAYLKHYRTKTLEEFMRTTLNRGRADIIASYNLDNYFWKHNEKTEEKLEALKKMTSGG